MIPRVRVGHVDGRWHVYDLSENRLGSLRPVASYDAPTERDSREAHPSLDGLVYATATHVVRLGADGSVRWRHELGEPTVPRYSAFVSCEFSLDGEFVWVYVPDALLDRGPDRLLVLDADGTAVAQAVLETAGHGAGLLAHPDGHMIVEIGEGQDGPTILRCRTEAGVLLMEKYPWFDRVLIGFSPDGSRFMTVDHGFGEDAAFHSYPSGEVVAVVTKSQLGAYDEEARIDWVGGYLDASTAIVAVIGYDEDTDKDWYRCHLVDPASGRVRGEWQVDTDYVDNVRPLGDGTWLQVRKDQHPQRHAFRTDVSGG